MTIKETNYFDSFDAALNHYRTQGLKGSDVTDKIFRKEIIIGRPTPKQDQSLFIRDGRYHIVDSKPSTATYKRNYRWHSKKI